KPLVPLGSFYGPGKDYLDPVERRKLREIQALGRGGDGNRSGNPDPGTAKRAPNPGRSLRKTGKGKAGIPAGKPSGDKEGGGNRLVRKKMDCPFRVLSMKVKPALKLRLGAAFFAAGKKSHSRKNPGDSQALPGSRREDAEPAGGREAPEERGVSGRIPEGRESSGNAARDPGHGGEASPRKTGSEAGASEAGSVGNGVTPASEAEVYPIFSAALAGRKRPLDEILSPFGNSPPGKVPHASRKSRKAKELCRRSRDQMIIDAGQKHFGAVVCGSCGMIYSAASPEDEAQHVQHHQRFLEALRYLGWKKERVVAEFWDGKIVLILPTDPKYAVKKVQGCLWRVRADLVYCTKWWVYVGQERGGLGKEITGPRIGRRVPQAFRVLSDPGRSPCPGRHSRAWRCSARPEPALCGISRIWVLGKRRRSGIARRLVDTLR
ncbi:ESCO2 acetyltransferase, partial [Neopipo cinnamomea]|nr:ESCO2 acetyltransferase [Neopipo cinnamomea]